MITTIGFDADDTLWHHENLFQETHAAFASLLSRWHDADTVERHLAATEKRNLGLYGYGVKGFTLSAMETALDLSRGEISAPEIRAILAHCRAILSHPVELIEGVQSTLAALAPHFRLFVITKGDLRDQDGKIQQSGLADFFSAKEIVTEKNVAVYRRILSEHAVSPSEFMMVGNSVRSDILPVLELGARAVHIPYPVTCAHEEAPLPPQSPRLHSLAGITELPALLNRLQGASS